MSNAMRIARAARRRRRWRALLRTLGRSMVFASALGIALALVDWWLRLGLAWWAVAAAPLALVAAALLWRASRTDDLAAAALEVDESLRLSDRLSSAVELERSGETGPFAQLAIADAERAAAEIRTSRAVRVGDARAHRWWPALAAAFVAIVVWLPPRDAATTARAGSGVDPERAEAAREQIAEARERTELELETQPELLDAATRRDLEALRRLEEELAAGERDPEEAGAQAAETLGKAAERLEQEAAQRRAALEELSRRVPDPEGDPLAEALARGDYQSVADELGELERRLDAATPEERREIAERLRRLSERIDATPSPEPPSPSETLEAQGVDPQTAQDLAEEPDPDRVRERLEQEGVDPLEAQRAAEDLARRERERQAQREAQQTAQDLKESLEQAAEQAERDSRPAPEGSGAPGEPPSDQPRESGPEDQGERQSGDSGGQEPTPGQSQPNEQPQSSPGEETPSGQNEQPGSGGRSEGGRQPGERPGAPTDSPGSGPEQPGGPGRPGGQSGAGDGMDRAQELARELERRGEGAAARSRQAEEFRRGAERLAGRPGSGQTGSDVGAAGDEAVRVEQGPDRSAASEALQTDDLDLRRGASSTRAAAEVDAEGPARAGRAPTRAEAAQALERAAPGAERALESQGVPSRFRDLVKRYFRAPEGAPLSPAPLAPSRDDGGGGS